MTLRERVDHYVKETGYPEALFVSGGDRPWIVGTWVMGNNYVVKSSYHGGYPQTYLKRVRAMFPDKKKILHLFSGKVDTSIVPGETVDLNPNNSPDYIDNAETLETVPLEKYDLVLADPPYAESDAAKYGFCLVNRNKVMQTLGARLKPGAHVVWLDQIYPMFSKHVWEIIGAIGIMRSTNHRFRLVTIFERKSKANDLMDCIEIGTTRLISSLSLTTATPAPVPVGPVP